MKILFKGNVPQEKSYSYSVKNNNNSNVITFELDKIQEDDLDLSSLTCFVKVKGAIIDKDVVTKTVDGDKLKIKWIMKRKHTKSRIISVQLQFEGYGESDIVWQTEMIEITLSNTIKADEYIENEFPGELMDHEARIQALENTTFNTYTREEIDAKDQHLEEEILTNKDIVIDNPANHENEEGLRKLIRKQEPDGSIHEEYVIDKKHIPQEFVDSEPIETRNGVQLNDAAKVKADLSRFNDVFGEAEIEPKNNGVYTAYYNKNEVETKAIRIGTASRYGGLEITGLTPYKEIKIVIGRYFRYDENNEKVFDSNCYLYIEDRDHDGNLFEITEEQQEISLFADVNGRIYIDNDASSIVEEGEVFGRLFIYCFKGEIAERTKYHAKKLARSEEVEAVHAEVVETNERLSSDENTIRAHGQSIIDINEEIDDINSRMGDVQIFDRNSLPAPGEKYLKKIFRVNGVLFQCVKVGDSVDKTFNFDNITGTSEITESNFDDFAQLVGDDFARNIELAGEITGCEFAPVQFKELTPSGDIKDYWVNDGMDLSGLINVPFFTIVEVENCYLFDIWTESTDIEWDNDKPFEDIDNHGIQQIIYTTESHVNILDNDGIVYGATAIGEDDIPKIKVGMRKVNGSLFNPEIMPYLVEYDAEVYPVKKLFKNNGDIRLGNSSQIGQFIFQSKNGLPFVEVTVELKAWGTTKSSAVKASLGNSRLHYASVIIPPNETRTITLTAPIEEDNSQFVLTSEKVGYNETRVIIKSMHIKMGQAEYVWKAAGGGASAGNDKSIILEILSSELGRDLDDEKNMWHRNKCRLYLKNFTADDIGTYIHLYRRSFQKHTTNNNIYDIPGQSRPMRFVHPINYDNETITNIAKFGYGNISGDAISNTDKFWGNVPYWMPHNGFIRTEYIITEEHISQGYMDINIGREFLCLLRPNLNDKENIDYETDTYVFKRSVTTFGSGQMITYMQVDSNKNIICYPKNMICFPSPYTLKPFIKQVVVVHNDQYFLSQSIQIKLLSF